MFIDKNAPELAVHIVVLAKTCQTIPEDFSLPLEMLDLEVV
jgi:hypothetical protein